jgi:hypothetical protein
MIFRIGGATIGLILYSAFGIISGLQSGYLSLAVGFIVGKAIRMGALRSVQHILYLAAPGRMTENLRGRAYPYNCRGMRDACDRRDQPC